MAFLGIMKLKRQTMAPMQQEIKIMQFIHINAIDESHMIKKFNCSGKSNFKTYAKPGVLQLSDNAFHFK